MSTKHRIQSVRIETQPDSDPDTSWLGTYVNQRIDRWTIERENAGHREYRWFQPCADNYAGLSDDDCAKYCRQDFERMEALNDGQWSFVGIIAKAVIVSPNGLCQTIRSGGLWGVEDDSGPDYLATVKADQLEELRAELEAFGFGKRAIAYAFRTISDR